jgi:ElaB/YqjD/DUF883 family membrane-anchored ribosome-binding protein
MKNPNGNKFTENDPLTEETEFGSDPLKSDAQGRLQQTARKMSDAAADTWEQTKEKATVARQRTELILRENPVPTVLGALALGLAIGLAIRYASSSEEKEVGAKNPLKDVNWSAVSIPFLWPFFKTVKRKYQDSTDAVKDSIDRVKDIDVDRYVKPLRKRWKAWTD